MEGLENYERKIEGMWEEGKEKWNIMEDIIDGIFNIEKEDGYVKEKEMEFI